MTSDLLDQCLASRTFQTLSRCHFCGETMDVTCNICASPYFQNKHPRGLMHPSDPQGGFQSVRKKKCVLFCILFLWRSSRRVCVLYTQEPGDFVCGTLWEMELRGWERHRVPASVQKSETPRVSLLLLGNKSLQMQLLKTTQTFLLTVPGGLECRHAWLGLPRPP